MKEQYWMMKRQLMGWSKEEEWDASAMALEAARDANETRRGEFAAFQYNEGALGSPWMKLKAPEATTCKTLFNTL